MIDQNKAPEMCYACAPESIESPCTGCVFERRSDLCDDCDRSCFATDRKDGENVIFKSLDLSDREKRLVLWALDQSKLMRESIACSNPSEWLEQAIKEGHIAWVLKGES